MERISKRFPVGLRYDIPFDTTRFVEVSIEEVAITFVEAIALVVLVVFLFLQSVRAMIIPVIAIPVSIIGTFAGMYVLGFSINLLTLFGLVLAIGIVVDDAIVVLENVERIMSTEGKSPRAAAIQAMQEVTGPVIAIVLVLCAVFIPVSFLGGLAGELYRQFAVTIAVSVVISGIVALTLTPALAALIAEAGARRAVGTVRPLQPLLRLGDGALHRRGGLPAAPDGARRRGFRRRAGAGGRPVPAHSRQPRAGRGPGLRLPGDDPAAGRRDRAHPRGDEGRHGGADEEPGRRQRRLLLRLRPPVARAQDQFRHLLRHAEGLVGAHRIPRRTRATSRRRSAPSTPTSRTAS